MRLKMRILNPIAATFLAAISLSCTLPRQPSEKTQSAPTRKIDYSPSEFIGKVKADEFNDQAAGKEVSSPGGQIVTRFEAEPDTLNSWLSGDLYSQVIASYLQSYLLRQDPETFEWQPSLAERWLEEDVMVKKDKTKLRGIVTQKSEAGGKELEIKTSSGETLLVPREEVTEIHHGASFTFFLRKNVRFHDGVPLTAADVKFSCDTIKNETVDDPGLRSYFNDVESCEVLDPYTARITYAKQYWLAKATVGAFEIIPKHIYDPDNLSEKDPKAFGKRFNESPYNRKPVGAGPYKFERWDTSSQVILTRNENYWDVPRRGHLDRLIFRFISDEVAALQALKNGEVDFIPTRLKPEQFDGDMNNPEFLKKFVKAEYFTGGYSWFGWNMRNPIFGDARVRQAMAYGALDIRDFIDKVMHRHAIQVAGEQYLFGPAYDHSVQPFPFDPERAKQLLLEAGWYDRDGDGLRDKDGKPFRFELLLPSGNDIYERRAALMKENLRKLGIDMTIRELEWATFVQNVTDRKFDACNMGWGGGIEDDPYQIWHTSQATGRGDNFVGFGNAETDRLIEQSRITLDDKERRKILFEFQRVLYEMQPYLFLYMPADLGAYHKRFRGVKFYRVRPGYDLTEWFLPKGE